MPHAPDLAGCTLDGRYELHELIGEGTFGRVYRGYDRRLARAVAIKVIKPWWAEDPEWAESFGHEAQLLARVSDAGIVQIYDVGQAEEGLYYVTELVEGESLAHRLKRGGRLAPWDACDIAEQLCRALEHAHAEQIVHRDIKPANVLISTRGRVKVGDLGIARLAEGTTDGGTATIVGTPRYMAPEQANGSLVSPATDVYSAGIVLFEMLAGEPPFNGESAVEIALRHVQEPVPPLPPATPRSIERVVQRALAKEPADRYQTAAAMADALAQARAAAQNGSHNGSRNGSGATAADPRERPPEPDTTRVAPRYSPRHDVNPAARRRTIAAFVLALGMLGVLVLARIVLTGRPTVTVPALVGHDEKQISAELRHAHLTASFSHRYDDHARSGTAISQSPSAHARVKQGSTIDVTMSKGPQPVDVPKLLGDGSSAAAARLHQLHLEATFTSVAAPGTAPGTVTDQSPTAGHHVKQHSTVTLLVAEQPRWQTVRSFSGNGPGAPVQFQIRGTRWQMVYTMAYDGTCDFVLICNGPNAHVIGLGAGNSTDTSFDLNDGGSQTRVFNSGPGMYQISIKPGWDSAHWTVTIEDWL
jgi:eukaryotic-like serine/threonine-protein kinase